MERRRKEEEDEDEGLTWALDQRENEGGESLDVVLALGWSLVVLLGGEGSKEIREEVGPSSWKNLSTLLL